jgi:Zn-dependent metalloprotease
MQAGGVSMSCCCFIIPTATLKRFARDKRLTAAQRKVFADAADFEPHWRKLRTVQSKAIAVASRSLAGAPARIVAPTVTVFDCTAGTTLPGAPIAAPDATAKRVLDQTAAVAEFYRTVFGRNSLDRHGMTLQSSIHYGVSYNNAFWNGTQMTYGDGDGNIFLNFTRSTDVIAHELTHGVTQYSARFDYANEAGGLNESVSDVFASMFRQWRRRQSVTKADWLIGRDILGPGAAQRGYKCIRDLARPSGKHCLVPQSDHYSQLKAGMEPHVTSGVPSLAFYKAAQAIGGKSWEVTGQIWYRALTDFAPSPKAKMKTFAGRTRRLAKSLYPDNTSVHAAVDEAWAAVGL